jgi:hypothetical protein
MPIYHDSPDYDAVRICTVCGSLVEPDATFCEQCAYRHAAAAAPSGADVRVQLWPDEHSHPMAGRCSVCTQSASVPQRPKIVCLCGSCRFKAEFNQVEFDETAAGRIVLTTGRNTKDGTRDVDWSHLRPMRDELHKRKIDLADEVLVLNVGGYIGDSTRSEIEYAKAHGKPIRYLEPPADEPTPSGEEE